MRFAARGLDQLIPLGRPLEEGVAAGLTCCGRGLRHLIVELAPLLLGPSELLRRRREIEEVDRNDRRSGPQIGIPDEGVELASCLGETGVDLAESFGLPCGDVVPVLRAQTNLPYQWVVRFAVAGTARWAVGAERTSAP